MSEKGEIPNAKAKGALATLLTYLLAPSLPPLSYLPSYPILRLYTASTISISLAPLFHPRLGGGRGGAGRVG